MYYRRAIVVWSMVTQATSLTGPRSRKGNMNINGTYIDRVELTEYWRMSSAYGVTLYKRMLWTSDAYSKAHDVPSVRAYKALDRILAHNTN